MTQLPVIRPGAILDLGDEHRLNEDAAFLLRTTAGDFVTIPLEQIRSSRR